MAKLHVGKNMTSRTKRILRITLVSFAVVLLLTIGVIWYIANNIEKLVTKALIEEVEKSSDGLYKLEMGDLNFSITNGMLDVEHIRIVVDSSVLYQLELKDEKPRYTVNFTAKTLNIDIENILKIRKGKKLEISNISVVEPAISLAACSDCAKNTVEKSDVKKLQKLSFFSSIDIGKIKLINGRMHYNNEKSTHNTYSINNFMLEVKNVKIDSFINSRNPFTHIEDVQLDANNIRYFMLDSALLLNVSSLSASLKNELVNIDSLSITPLYTKYEFAQNTPNHSDIIDLSIKNIRVSGIDFNELINRQAIAIDSIAIDSFKFWSFKNKKIPPIVSKEKPLFHQLVHKVNIPIYVSNITVNNGRASYEELSINGENPGKVDFTDLSLDIKGLTNRARGDNNFYTIGCSGKLYGKGLLEATLRFPADSINDYYEIDGHFGKMDLAAINQILTPLAAITITSGTAQSMTFFISGNSKTSETDMRFLYNDLEIEILNPNKDNRKKRKFISGIVNTLFINSSNPTGNNAPKQIAGVISQRDRFLSNFNYWWRSIKEGVLSSTGLPGM